MLYLPRLFVYHCEAEAGSKQSETFKVMERRLLKAIINPAMIVTWLAGLYLAWAGHWFSAGWLHGKLLLVVVLSGVHGFFSRCVKDFAADRNQRSQKFYRGNQRGTDRLDDRYRYSGSGQAVLGNTCRCRRASDAILRKRWLIFYIAAHPTLRRRMWSRPGFLVGPAAASGLKPFRRFPCSDLRTSSISRPHFQEATLHSLPPKHSTGPSQCGK